MLDRGCAEVNCRISFALIGRFDRKGLTGLEEGLSLVMHVVPH